MQLRRWVVVLLSQMGQEALRTIGIAEEGGEATLFALETDESGLWVSCRRADGEHWVLIRWDCILAVDVPVGGTPNLEAAV
jgi:hypothetical protein